MADLTRYFKDEASKDAFVEEYGKQFAQYAFDQHMRGVRNGFVVGVVACLSWMAIIYLLRLVW